MRNPERAYEKIDRSRKAILMAFIVYIIAFVILSTIIGTLGFSSKTAVERVQNNVNQMQESYYRELKIRNSTLLMEVQNSWQSYDFDLSRGDFDEIYQRFSNRVVSNLTLVDYGELAVVVDIQTGEVITDRSDGVMMELFAEEITTPHNILYNNAVSKQHSGEEIIMNKVVLPAPHSRYPMIAVATAYSVQGSSRRFVGMINSIEASFYQLQRDSIGFQFLLFAWLVITIILGGVIAISMRSILSNAHCLEAKSKNMIEKVSFYDEKKGSDLLQNISSTEDER